MLKINRLLKCSLAGSVLALGLNAGAHAADVTLKVHHFLPKQAPAHKNFLVPWKKAVEEESNGRIKVKIYPAMQLGGKAPNLIDQVKDGFVDVIWTLPSYTPGRFPAISAFELPFMITNAEETSQALQAYYESNKAAQDEFKDYHPLFFFTHDRGVIHSKTKPIKSLADLKGMKIRIPSRPVADAMTAYGAVPVAMPVPQMPSALAKNVIDGTVIPWEVVPAFRLHELADSSTEITGDRGIYTSVFVFAMNKKKYQSLPADLKKVIDNNSGISWSKAMGKVWTKAEEPGRNMAKKRGNALLEMPAGDVAKMREVAVKVHADWVEEMNGKGLDGQALLDSANALLNKYSSK
jgi:TRAP-type C4-dicarboxylate transport system substrate-binding protein